MFRVHVKYFMLTCQEDTAGDTDAIITQNKRGSLKYPFYLSGLNSKQKQNY